MIFKVGATFTAYFHKGQVLGDKITKGQERYALSLKDMSYVDKLQRLFVVYTRLSDLATVLRLSCRIFSNIIIMKILESKLLGTGQTEIQSIII